VCVSDGFSRRQFIMCIKHTHSCLWVWCSVKMEARGLHRDRGRCTESVPPTLRTLLTGTSVKVPAGAANAPGAATAAGAGAGVGATTAACHNVNSSMLARYHDQRGADHIVSARHTLAQTTRLVTHEWVILCNITTHYKGNNTRCERDHPYYPSII